VKATVQIYRSIATINPPLLWHWSVHLWGGNNRGHIFASGGRSLTRLGAVVDFMRRGLKWYIRALWL
jgi:hypothetical protein